MVLKEAYQYQNYLTSLINEACGQLATTDFITTTKQIHQKKKVNPNDEDEEIEVPKVNPVPFTPAMGLDFLVKAISEKQKLSDAIAKAKKSLDMDIDSAIAMNKQIQIVIRYLKSMTAKKPSEKQSPGTGYRFDVNGEQKPYVYTIKEITTINFDRDNVKKLIQKYRKQTDEISARLDVIQVTTVVDYTPVWELGDSLEDAIVS